MGGPYFHMTPVAIRTSLKILVACSVFARLCVWCHRLFLKKNFYENLCINALDTQTAKYTQGNTITLQKE